MSNNAQSCIGHYKMDDNTTSTTVIDDTGTANGVYTSVGGNANTADHDVAGHLNNALDFVGDDDYIVVADNIRYTPALSPFSISAWCYMDSTQNFCVASKRGEGTDGEWEFRTILASKIWFRIYDQDVNEGNCYIGRMYDTSLASYAGMWIHLVGTYDGGTANSGIKIYLNGVRIDDADSDNDTFVTVRNGGADVYIGRNATQYTNGKIDNLMFFTKELSPVEVNALYNGGSGIISLEEMDRAEQLTRTLRRQ